MHPDTERYLSELRYRLDRERVIWRFCHIPKARAVTAINLSRDHAARIGARLRSLRDWPQPGRPA